ncbi:MAG: hypothetical protein JWP51_1653 [Bradyrhizobium sp.]|jgi:hypothetical protein|nr:hypothetical protein [Bradyrhizobium sp.]
MSESLHAESRPAEAYSSDALPTSRPDMLKRLNVTPAVLIFDAGVPIYPELTAELDVIKRQPIGGLMLCRDCWA